MDYRDCQKIVHFHAALELLRYKALQQMCIGKTTCFINEDDVNEILSVANMPLITPESIMKKEVTI